MEKQIERILNKLMIEFDIKSINIEAETEDKPSQDEYRCLKLTGKQTFTIIAYKKIAQER